MLFFKTPRHTAVTGLVLICLLAAAFWIHHVYTNRVVVLSEAEMLAEIEAIWDGLDEWEAHFTAANDSEGLAEVERLRERRFEMVQEKIDRMDKLNREPATAAARTRTRPIISLIERRYCLMAPQVVTALL